MSTDRATTAHGSPQSEICQEVAIPSSSLEMPKDRRQRRARRRPEPLERRSGGRRRLATAQFRADRPSTEPFMLVLVSNSPEVQTVVASRPVHASAHAGARVEFAPGFRRHPLTHPSIQNSLHWDSCCHQLGAIVLLEDCPPPAAASRSGPPVTTGFFRSSRLPRVTVRRAPHP